MKKTILSASVLAFLALAVFSPRLLSAQEIWTTGKGTISLNVSEAKFIRLEKPAAAVFLSNPDVAEIDLQSARYVYIVGRSIGETSLFVLGPDDEEILSTTLSVGIDTDRLAEAAQSSIGGGYVSVKTVNGAIFLTGKVRSPDDAATAEDVVAKLAGESAIVVNRLELENSAQVNLQVRIAEVSRTISEDLGISLTAGTGRKHSLTSPSTNIDGFQISVKNGAQNVNLVLDALAKNGLVTILSEPNLTARSGETATFLAGGQIPYKIGETPDDTRIELQTIGVELEFTPTVINEDQIQIKLSTRVRDVDTSQPTAGDNPALSERSATTTIDLGSGQSFAIAGMFRTDTQQSMAGLPGLAKLPILGALFRSSKFSRGETELVIIVTPYLVEPTSPDNLSTPVDTLNPISGGLEQALTGRFTRPLRPGAPGTSRVRGGGFLLK
ncbi:type II and III secretion system protein family protein [Cypionkella sp.]|uniref:type II and III secretion system protein family protein n=1 Tax=Cypionkella sp. TaxID=2811411 RepID=UPI002ABCF60F|nr:type II and III secretion system protein family protein [Cypionkella sp.]MDZ4394366.1 type II and III secretion system protein family protein [Cypionkella sp.]